MQKEPKIKWSFKVKTEGEGADLETAFHDAVINIGLQDHDGTDCEPVIESFTCPCGNECIAVQSENKCDLENEFARDYVCKVDGRRWTVDFGGEVYEQRRWVVLTVMASGGFENCWLDDLGSDETQQMPCTFATQRDASLEVAEHIRGSTTAYIHGHIQDIPTRDDFKIVRLREYLNLDELEKQSGATRRCPNE